MRLTSTTRKNSWKDKLSSHLLLRVFPDWEGGKICFCSASTSVVTIYLYFNVRIWPQRSESMNGPWTWNIPTLSREKGYDNSWTGKSYCWRTLQRGKCGEGGSAGCTRPLPLLIGWESCVFMLPLLPKYSPLLFPKEVNCSHSHM